MTTSSSKKSTSSAETSQRIKALLKELPEERADAARLDELRRLFAKLVTNGELSFHTAPSNPDTPTAKWNAFLQKKHKAFVSQLCQRIEEGKKTAVRTMWGVIAASPSQSASLLKRVNDELMYQWMKSMICTPNMDKAMRTMVEGEFLHPYRDVQYYALVAIAKLAAEQYHVIQQPGDVDEEMEVAAERLFQLLLMIPIPTTQEQMEQSSYLFTSTTEEAGDDDSDDEESVGTNESRGSNDDSSDAESSEEDEDNTDAKPESRKRKREPASSQRKFAFQQLKSHKKALSNAWLAVLKLPLPTLALKSALQFLPSNVIPHVPNPLLFADFFMQAYEYSGVIGVLALDGLFVLMTHHGLEYPLFYTSLYRLVQPSMLYVKYRTRFFELLTKCLCRNEMLPAHLVASFVKRILRSALNAPPPGILFSLALVANLLRKHPECAALIHRGDMLMEEDPFDARTHDLTQTRGGSLVGRLESCSYVLLRDSCAIPFLSNHIYCMFTFLCSPRVFLVGAVGLVSPLLSCRGDTGKVHRHRD